MVVVNGKFFYPVTAIASEVEAECTSEAEREPTAESKRGMSKRQMKRSTP